jgi:hypothetical protein
VQRDIDRVTTQPFHVRLDLPAKLARIVDG